MVPLLLELFTNKAGITDNEFLNGYIAAEKHKLLSYLNDELSGADFMLSFDLIMLAKREALGDYPHIKQYALQLASLDSYQRSMRLEANHDQSI